MAADRPHIENAPGLTWRRCAAGWEARWRPRADIVRRGYLATPASLWRGTELTDTDRAYISDRCQQAQSEMLVFGRGGIPVTISYDGTLHSLIHAYQHDADSNYRKKLRFKTREHYDSLLKRIDREHGAELIADVTGRMLLRWHEEWSKVGIPIAHSLVGMLRTLTKYGVTLLDDKQGTTDCRQLKSLLSDMRFQMGKPREETLSADQANMIRAMAHEKGRPSMALAQAFQFECTLRQKDVIGEWVPSDEPGISEIQAGHWKWLRGLRWSEIDGSLILRHETSKKEKPLVVDLRLAPMVMDELAKLGERPTSGAVIISELHGIPYTSHEFRREWRKLADACGIPKTVWNMDSRAGAITEATEAGAELEHVRHAATHSDIATTQRYSRGAAEKIAKVMQIRVARRNKSGT